MGLLPGADGLYLCAKRVPNKEGRIEALFLLSFLTLLVQALIEREPRRSIRRDNLDYLPLYPGERATHNPTADQIFKLCSLAQRHNPIKGDGPVHTFELELTDLQCQVLGPLGVAEDA